METAKKIAEFFAGCLNDFGFEDAFKNLEKVYNKIVEFFKIVGISK